MFIDHATSCSLLLSKILQINVKTSTKVNVNTGVRKLSSSEGTPVPVPGPFGLVPFPLTVNPIEIKIFRYIRVS